MKKVVHNYLVGDILYEESFWTGKKSLSFNGTPLTKVDKRTFKTVLKDENNEEKETFITVRGSFISGTFLDFNKTSIEIYPKLKWYEIILCLLPFILDLIWGNSVTLCSIIPVVGGAIGGLISALFSFLSVFLMRKTSNILVKIAIALAVLLASFGVCALVGYLIISALAA
ncbi:MAG: hypothetical protein ACI311_03505 [Bacilli bacterium]